MGVSWFGGNRSVQSKSVRNAKDISHRNPSVQLAAATMIESLERRVLLSGTTVITPVTSSIPSGPPPIVRFIVSSVTATSSNPAGNLVLPNLNSKTFIIDYHSSLGIDPTTIGIDNVTVTGPINLVVSSFSIQSTTATDAVVQYTFQKAGGGNFTPKDNGTYNVNTTATVADTNTPPDVEVPRTPIDFFLVNIPDITPPVATKFTGADVSLAGGRQSQFSITYADDVAINVSSVSTSNVTITAPNGQTLPVVAATITPPDVNGTPITVTYTVQYPALLSASDNGTYYVSINNTLTDTSGNAIVPVVGVGTYTVDLPDVSAPSIVTFTPPTVNTGDTADTFTVTYTDNVAIDVSTLGSSNVFILGPFRQQMYATYVSSSPTTNSTQVTATYSFTAPNTTTFTSADNGVYTFSLLSDVTDTAGNTIPAQQLGTLNLALNPADIARTEIGQFGDINGKNVPLHFRDIPQGGVGTFRLSGGVGQVYLETSNSLIDIYVADAGAGVKLSISSDANHPLQLGNVLISGSLLNGSAATSQLHGTFFATGGIQKLNLANIFGSLIAAGPIGTISVGNSITAGQVLSGVNLGSDGQFGGTGTAADTYGAGSIAAIKVGSTIASTFIGAGVKPDSEGQFNSGSDTIIGGSSSVISYLQAKIVDKTSKFQAGSFGKAKFGNKFVNITTDSRFAIPPAATT